jgi:hypothetical protein
MKMFRGMEITQTGFNGSTVNICGYSPTFESKPLVYWCQDSSGLLGNTGVQYAAVCVSACPGAAPAVNGSAGLFGQVTNAATSAIPGTVSAPPECQQKFQQQIGYGSQAFLDRYCLPVGQSVAMFAGLKNSTDEIEAAVEVMEGVSSVWNAWPVLLGAFFIAIVTGYVYLILLKCCAEPLIWISAIASIVGFASLGAYMFFNAASLQVQAQQQAVANGVDLPAGFAENTAKTSRIVGIVLGCMSLGLACLICCFHSSIKTAAAVVEVSCEAMWEMPLLLITPLLKALLKGAAFSVIMYGGILAYTSADPVPCPGVHAAGMCRTFHHDNTQLSVLAGYTFCSLWILCFLDAFYQFLVAYMVADYYYSPYEDDGEKDLHQCGALCEGIKYGLITHAGSLAFGSLLIAIIMFLQKVLEYAEKKNKEAGNNAIVSCIIGTALGCLGCCKQMIEFINKNAYIDIAVEGDSGFCSAAKKAMQVIIQEGAAMTILNGATYIFSVFGSLLITVGSGFIVYLIINNGSYNDVVGPGSVAAIPDKSSVVIVALFLAFMVSLVFMNVFDMTADTLIFCYGFDRTNGHVSSTAPMELRQLCSDAEQQAGQQQQLGGGGRY